LFEAQKNAPGYARAFDRSCPAPVGARRQAEQSLAEGCCWPAVGLIRRMSTARLCRIERCHVKASRLESRRTRAVRAALIGIKSTDEPLLN
jgi:hypothetical protein